LAFLETIELGGGSGGGSETESGHSHSNFNVLETITLQKVVEWDNKSSFSGNYNDLLNKPNIPTKMSQLSNDIGLSTFNGNYNNLTNKPNIPSKMSQLTNDIGLSTFDGNYNSLKNKPYIPTKLSDLEIDMNIGSGGGNESESGHSHSNLQTLEKVTSAKITTWDNKSDFSGNYNDLSNKPLIPTKMSQLSNDVGMSTFDGNYNSLTNKPIIPINMSQLTDDIGLSTFSGNYNDLRNKPYIPTRLSDLEIDINIGGGGTETESGHSHSNFSVLEKVTSAKIAIWDGKSDFSGNYIDLTNKPTIPTKLSQLSNDIGFSTFSGNYDDLTNRPLIPTRLSDLEIDINISGGTGSGHTHSNFLTLEKITPTKMATWDSKSDFSGNYHDLTNKPLIPTKLSDLEIDMNISGGSNGTESGHSHNNLSTLDKITPSKITSWDNKSNFSGNYNDLTNKPYIPTKISDLEMDISVGGEGSGHTHSNLSTLETITSANITAWNNKSNFSGNYNDLTNKPYIPTKMSQLTNDIGMSTFNGDYNNLTNKPTIPTKLSDLTDDVQFNSTITNTTTNIANCKNDTILNVAVVGDSYRYQATLLVGKNCQADELSITTLQEHHFLDTLEKGKATFSSYGTNVRLVLPSLPTNTTCYVTATPLVHNYSSGGNGNTGDNGNTGGVTNVNLFTGEYLDNYYLTGNSGDNTFGMVKQSCKSFILNVEPNTEYTIFKEETEAESGYYYFKVASFTINKDSLMSQASYTADGAVRYSQTYKSTTEYTFTTGANDKSVLIVVSRIHEPYMEIFKEYNPNQPDDGGDSGDSGTQQTTQNKLVKNANSITLTIGGRVTYTLRRQTASSLNLDTWRLTDSAVDGDTIWSSTDMEAPIKEVGANDFIGGFHGDETFESVEMICDGTTLDMSNNYDMNFTNLVVNVKSTVYRCESTTPAFTRYKTLQFNKGDLTISNRMICLLDSFVVDRYCGCGLYSIYQDLLDGYEVNTRPGEIITSGNVDSNKNLDCVTFYGKNDFTATLKVLSGKTDYYKGFVVHFSGEARPRFKIYFDAIATGSGYTLKKNEELSASYMLGFNFGGESDNTGGNTGGNTGNGNNGSTSGSTIDNSLTTNNKTIAGAINEIHKEIVDARNSTYSSLDSRLDGINSSLSAINSNYGSFESRLDAIDSEIDVLNSKINFGNNNSGNSGSTGTTTTSDDSAVSVKQFGAKGNGSTDDTKAFQDAINYCLGTLGTTNEIITVKIPSGRYKVTSTITTYPQIKLVATGFVQIESYIANGTVIYLRYPAKTGLGCDYRGNPIHGNGHGIIIKNMCYTGGSITEDTSVFGGNNIAIELGTREADDSTFSDTRMVARYGIDDVIINGFRIGMKMNGISHFMGHYELVRIKLCDTCVQIGEYEGQNQAASIENFNFDSCLFERSNNVIKWVRNGVGLTFNNCSVDYIRDNFMLATQSGARRIIFNNGHIEKIRNYMYFGNFTNTYGSINTLIQFNGVEIHLKYGQLFKSLGTKVLVSFDSCMWTRDDYYDNEAVAHRFHAADRKLGGNNIYFDKIGITALYNYGLPVTGVTAVTNHDFKLTNTGDLKSVSSNGIQGYEHHSCTNATTYAIASFTDSVSSWSLSKQINFKASSSGNFTIRTNKIPVKSARAAINFMIKSNSYSNTSMTCVIRSYDNNGVLLDTVTQNSSSDWSNLPVNTWCVYSTCGSTSSVYLPYQAGYITVELKFNSSNTNALLSFTNFMCEFV
jgi:hypothetical protein